jgi:hypothetical protein
MERMAPASSAGPIVEQQDSEEMIFLLRAVSVSHQRARRLDAVNVSVSVLLAACGLVATVVDRLAVPVTVIGALWAIGYGAGLARWTDGELVRAATLQEMFDVRLFGLPWNVIAAGERLGAEEVSWLAHRYRGDEAELFGYYEVPPLRPPYDVVACQLQNLAWGSRVRRRYARALLGAVGIWSVAGLTVGIVSGLTVTDIVLRWYVPSLGALLLAWNSFRTQREVAGERQRVMAILWDQVRATAAGSQSPRELVELTRQVQDAIVRTRRRNIRVPNWFFSRFKDGDRRDFVAVVAELTRTVDLSAVASR